MKRISEQDFENTLSKIYQAALDVSLWDEVLLDIGQPFKAHSGQLVTVSKSKPAVSFDLLRGVGRTASAELDTYVRTGRCPRATFGLSAPAGSISSDYMHTTEREMKSQDFYQEFCRTYDAQYYSGLILAQDQDRFTAIGIFRANQFGHFFTEETLYLRRLMPHLQRSVELMQALGNKGALSGLLTALENLAGGAVIINYRGQIAGMNTKAATILARDDGIYERDKHVLLSDKHAQHKLNQELRNALSFDLTSNGANSHYIRSECRTSLSPYILYVSPIRMAEDYFHNFAGIIYITDPHSAHETLKTVLMEAYGLTVSEAELVEYLCEGMSLKEFAEQHNISIEAPRYHLKNIFQKMNVRRQSELVALVMKTLPSRWG